MTNISKRNFLKGAAVAATLPVVGAAHAAHADDRHIHRTGHRLDQVQIHAPLEAFAVHAGQQDLAGTAGGGAWIFFRKS